MDRRHFLSMLGLGAVGLALPGVAQADILKQAAANPNIKPISGSWFEFQHPGGKEGVYWDKDSGKEQAGAGFNTTFTPFS